MYADEILSENQYQTKFQRNVRSLCLQLLYCNAENNKSFLKKRARAVKDP